MSGRRVRLTAHGWERPLLIEAWEPEPPTGDGVLIRIEAASVCHRDLIDRDGRFAFQRLPITPGHESAGRVLAVGPGVTDFRIGDRVGTMHRDACGRCPPCLAGQTSLCGSGAAVLGLLIDGTYASHIAVPQSALFPLTDEIDAAEAATLHCTFGTALHALETLGGLRAGERV